VEGLALEGDGVMSEGGVDVEMSRKRASADSSRRRCCFIVVCLPRSSTCPKRTTVSLRHLYTARSYNALTLLSLRGKIYVLSSTEERA